MLVRMAPRIPRRMILTGTPVTKANRVHDLYMQWRFLNPAQLIATRYEDFRTMTGVWVDSGGFPIWRGPREEGIARVKAMIAPDSVIVTRDECFDLPPSEHRIVPVTLSKDTAKHYNDMATTMVTMLKSGAIAEASIPLVVTLRLLQLTSGFIADEHKNIHTVGHEKLDTLRDMLTDELDGQKVVIAARFRYDLDAIAALTAKLRIPTWAVRGGLTQADTTAAIDAFRSSDDGVMLIQPAAAALGIDLSTAHHMVWYSLTYSWVDWSQANDRIALSPVGTTYHTLLATDTVDHLVYDTLRSDGEIARAIMANPERLLHR